MPSLAETNGYEIPASGQLWLNSSGVNVATSTGNNQNLSIEGRLRMSAGTYTVDGITYKDGSSSSIYVEGGTVNANSIATGTTVSFTYYQSGGTVNVLNG